MDTLNFIAAFCSIFVAFGCAILFTYWEFYRFYSDKCVDDEKLLIWAFWGHPWFFGYWIVSALVSTVSFISFSIWVLINTNDIVNWDTQTLLLAYASFMFFSMMYSPWMIWEKEPSKLKKCIVMMDLLAVSASLLCLFVWVHQHVGWAPVGNACLTCGMLVLTIHCTLLDCFFWGVSWCLNVVYKDGKFWCLNVVYENGELKQVEMVKRAFTRSQILPWPTISRADFAYSSSKSSSSSTGVNLRL